MKLIELHLKAFGCLSSRDFHFQPQMNVIFGPNEAGKSTLQQAIVALLYGFYDNQRALARERESHARFRPWRNGTDYAGSLHYQLADGTRLIVQRDFSGDEVTTQVFDAVTGEDITSRYSRGRHGRVDFMEKQAGMSREVFLATACIGQGALRNLQARESTAVSDALLRLLDSAVTETSAERALERLELKMRELGSDRSQKTLLAMARARLEDLHETHALRLAMQRAVQEDYEKIERLTLDLDELNAQIAVLDRQLLLTRRELLRQRRQRWQRNEEQRARLIAEIAELALFENFPMERKEEFFKLRDEFLYLERHLANLAGEANDVELRLMALAEKSKAMQPLEKLWEKHSLEDFRVLCRRWQDKYHESIEAGNRASDADQALARAGLKEEDRLALANMSDSDLENYKALETRVQQSDEEVTRIRKEHDLFHRNVAYWRRVLAFAGLVAGICMLYVAVSTSSTSFDFSNMLVFGLSVIILIIVIVVNVQWNSRSRSLNFNLVSVEEKYMANRDEFHSLQLRFGIETVADLAQRRAQYQALAGFKQVHHKLELERKKIEDDLQPWMAALGISYVGPDSLPVAEKNLEESHRLWSEARALRQRRDELLKQQAESSANLAKTRWLLEELLQLAHIDEPVGEKAFQIFLANCQKREYLETLRLQEQQAATLSREILEGETVEAINAQIAQLEAQLATLPPAAAREVEVSAAGLTALREKRERLQAERNNLQQLMATTRERIAARLQGQPPLAELEEEIALVEADVARFERARRALELAHETLTQAAQRLHRDFAPRLNEFLSQHVQRLTKGRYMTALVDPSTFAVRVLPNQYEAPVDLEKLSFGTREQIYLLLRAAVVALFAKSGETMPLLLDDPLAHADESRLRAALAIFAELAESHQIFYFTKDIQVVNYFRARHGAEAIITI
ncbi:MAG: AAA family ATPase [candidate division KSB1 bacterium]|nr:AAA family ATPase [candidate division KSB1 bacterium]MDZ7275320.1 AAA family ATPase [candidate division KSB1 bacterium]MDZ7287487.1 AAA family ATPase [candidate division KSB1 bacterium]MDZ7299601.1 AAA family ATPase [candidate division KSB1 bacterium]MDZ7307461.1 AAA family ATPase [candidate division KSB1 bacterium]